MALEIISISLISRFFLALGVSFFLSGFLRKRKSYRNAPRAPSSIPFLGHLWGIMRQGLYPYACKLSATQTSPILTVKIPGQTFQLVRPSESKQLSRVPNLSVAGAFYFGFGRSFGLKANTGRLMMDLDKNFFKELSRVLHQQFMSAPNLRVYLSQVDNQVCRTIQELPKELHTNIRLGDWIFELLTGALGKVVWGESLPFEDADFRRHVRVFLQNIDVLANPITFRIPSHIRNSRKIVRDTISQLGAQTRPDGYCERNGLLSAVESLLGRFDVKHDGWVDSQVMLLTGLLPSGSKVLTWCLYEIFANPDLKTTILAEINNLAIASDSSTQQSTLTVDLSRIEASCPHLVAVWYEILRLRGDFPIVRYVHKDTTFASEYRLRKGEIVMVPLQQVHFSTSIWGRDAHTFRPDRFLDLDGQLDQQKIKQVKTFGLPEPQCPGRSLAYSLVMSLVVRLLLTFEFTPVDNGKFQVPKVSEGGSFGPTQVTSDPEILLERRSPRDIVILFDSVVQRW